MSTPNAPQMGEDAISPIIATILLTAITVVLAATVFFLVADTDGEDLESQPRLSVFSDSTTRSNNWVMKIGGATSEAALTDYEFVHTTPNAGMIVYRASDDSGFTGSNGAFLSSGDLTGVDASSITRSDTTTTKADDQPGYRLRIQDISGDDLFTVLDTMHLQYDGTDADGSYDEPLPRGIHRVELRHVMTDSIAASVSNAF